MNEPPALAPTPSGLTPPSPFRHWDAIQRRLSGHPVALFLDYDGTLTPIVARPELARLPDDMRRVLEACAAVCPTAIVSGRGREDVAALVGLPQLTYAGSHGYDVAGPDGSNIRLEMAAEVVPLIEASAADLMRHTAGIPGVLVESKRFSVAVHYRQAPPDAVPSLMHLVDTVLAREDRLRPVHGKMVVELRPALDWDKGKAVLWLLDRFRLEHPDIAPVFIGDDTTDEDAFGALPAGGLGIVVMESPRPTAAHYSVGTVDDVRLFLERLCGVTGKG